MYEQPYGHQHYCQLCARKCHLTFHHLIPRKVHRRSYFKKHYNKAQLNTGIMLCRLCHKGLHTLYDEMTLAKQFNNLSQLQADARISQHVDWVRKQKVAI
jgi:5-methylcytosine-specific restriction endonuclease McrA